VKWFRLYSELIDDQKVHQMNEKTFKIFIFLLCFACEQEADGAINLPKKDILWRLRVGPKAYDKAIKQLEQLHILSNSSKGLQLLNWDKRQFKSDNVSERVKRYRETLHETHQNRDRTETETE